MPPAKKPKALTLAEAQAVLAASAIQGVEAPIILPIAEKPPHGNKGKKASEKQLENMRKGMAALKAKREAIKQKKAEREAKIAAGEPVSEDEDSQPPPPKKPVGPPILYVKPPHADKGKPKPRNYASKDDLNNLIETVKAMTAPQVVEKEVIKEVPVEREVIKERIVERVLTGSDILDRMYFGKQ